MFKIFTKKNGGVVEVQKIEISLPSKEELFNKAVDEAKEKFLFNEIEDYLAQQIYTEEEYLQTKAAINDPDATLEKYPKAIKTYSLGCTVFGFSLNKRNIISLLVKQVLKDEN